MIAITTRSSIRVKPGRRDRPSGPWFRFGALDRASDPRAVVGSDFTCEHLCGVACLNRDRLWLNDALTRLLINRNRH